MTRDDDDLAGLPAIAATLGVSPATVRKHAEAIHAADPLALRRHLLTGRWRGSRKRLRRWLESL